MNIKSIFLILAIIGFITNCTKSKSDNTKTLAALLLLNQSSTKLSTTQAKNAGTTRTAVSSAARSAASAAKGGNVSFINLPSSKYMNKELFAELKKKNVTNFLTKLRENRQHNGMLLTGNGGMSCNSDFSSCTGTLNGTASCDTAAGGGTVTLTNVVTTMAFTTTSGMENQSGSLKGTLKLNKCGSRTANYFDYPNYATSIASGTVTIDSTYTYKYNSYSISGENITVNGSGLPTSITYTTSNNNQTINEKLTTSSSDFSAGGSTIAFSNLVNDLKVTVDSKGTNVKVGLTYDNSQNISKITFTGDFEDTLDGSLITSGTLSGESISSTYTYDKTKVYKYSVSCSGDIATSAFDCTITNK